MAFFPERLTHWGNVRIEPKAHRMVKHKEMVGAEMGPLRGSYAYDAFGAPPPIPRNSTRGNSQPVPSEMNTNVAASTAGYLPGIARQRMETFWARCAEATLRLRNGKAATAARQAGT